MDLRIVRKKILTSNYYRVQCNWGCIDEWVDYDGHIFPSQVDADCHLYDIINGEDIWEAVK